MSRALPRPGGVSWRQVGPLCSLTWVHIARRSPCLAGVVVPVLLALCVLLWSGPAEDALVGKVSVPVVLSPEAVTEAPEGISDSNWVVGNLANGIWGTPPYYPGQQWLTRHIGEPGYDIWCRLDLGRPRLLHRMVTMRSQLGSFVHPRDLRLEFSDGSSTTVTMRQDESRQAFDFAPVVTSWVKIHLVNHYGDGHGIDANSGGLAEVQLFEALPAEQVAIERAPFTLGAGGEITAGLLCDASERPGEPPAEGAFVDGRGTWRLAYGTRSEPRLGGPRWFACELAVPEGASPALQVAGGGRSWLDGTEVAPGTTLAAGPHRLLCEAGGEGFGARLDGAGATRLLLPLQHTEGRPESILASLEEPSVRPRFLRPGERGRISLLPGNLSAPLLEVRNAAAVLSRVDDSRADLSGEPLFPLSLDAYKGAEFGTLGLEPGLYAVRSDAQPGVPATFAITPHGAPTDGLYDLSGDGRPDMLVFHWHGKLTVFLGDDGKLPWSEDLDRDWSAYFDSAYSVDSVPQVVWNPERGNWGSYTLLVDRTFDGGFDARSDWVYQIVDLDKDGDPDIERYGADMASELIAKYCFDLDDDNKQSNIHWAGPVYADEQQYTGPGNYLQDTSGNGFFANTKLRIGGERFADITRAWENPIAWYDLDDDGCTELIVRATDNYAPQDGRLREFEVAFDIDNSATPENQSSMDIQLTKLGFHSAPYDYSGYTERLPGLAGMPEADYLFQELAYFRRETRRTWIPYFDAYKVGTELDVPWESCFLLVDEDDDDNRWEEMFSPHEGYGYEDHLGDRWESDDDYSGKGLLYVGAFDGRWHLYGADRAEWTIDSRALYKGSFDRVGTAEGPAPPKGLRYSLVRYADTDGNGFIDRITYGEAVYGDQSSFVATREVNLLDYATAEDPHPDVCPTFDVKTSDPLTNRKIEDWDGSKVEGLRLEAYDRLRALFQAGADSRWEQALGLYRAAKAAGLLRSEGAPELPEEAARVAPGDKAALAALRDIRPGRGYASLLAPGTLFERYQRAQALAERVLADVLDATPEARHRELERLYYTGRLQELATALGR